MKQTDYKEWNMEEWGETKQRVAHHGMPRLAPMGTHFKGGCTKGVVVQKQKETNHWLKRYGWIKWWR